MKIAKALLKCHVPSCLIALMTISVGLSLSTNISANASIKLNVLVTDKSGQPVVNLNQHDFLVLEEGQPQAISFFQKKDIPVSYGLIVDNTGSMRSKLSEVIRVAKAIVNNSKLEDRTFIARLTDNSVQIAADWTSDKTVLLNTLTLMNDAKGMTPLIDSIYLCSKYFTTHESQDIPNRRRILILISDGLEMDSSKRIGELINQLHKDNMQVYAVGIMTAPERSEFIFGKNLREKAADFLDKLVEETGGRSFYPQKESELQEAARLIAEYMHSQYVIGYDAPKTHKNDVFYKVRLKLTDKSNSSKYKATARLRYFASK